MYIGRDFPPARKAESRPFGLDFVNDLGPGEHIVKSTCRLSVAAGVDPWPQRRQQGPSFPETTDDNTVPTAAVQRIGGLLPGVNYRVEFEVETNLGNIVVDHSYVYCESPL